MVGGWVWVGGGGGEYILLARMAIWLQTIETEKVHGFVIQCGNGNGGGGREGGILHAGRAIWLQKIETEKVHRSVIQCGNGNGVGGGGSGGRGSIFCMQAGQ